MTGSDVTFAYFSALQDCHLMIITVNSNDTRACCNKIADAVTNTKNVVVFSLQRGVKNSDVVKEVLENKGFIVIEAVVGFAVVLDPKYSACISTLVNPSILFERLTKENEKSADGPLRLLESMDIQVFFRKTLTRQ